MALNAKGKPEQTDLVRIKDPWGNSNEWSGECSDFDKKFWTPDNKSAFAARNVEDQDAAAEENFTTQRCVHKWNNTSDGVFVMKIKDFMKYFNQLTICRKIDKSWYEAEYREVLNPSYGPMTTKSSEWLQNP